MNELGKYHVVLADPAWKFRNKTIRGGALRHYNTMPMLAIKQLRVERVVEDDAALFIWVPSPLLDGGIEIVRAWGFGYRTVAFVWTKMTNDGSRRRIGCGFYTRPETELCLLGIRGKMPVADRAVRQVIEAPRQEHSRKPTEQYERIERLYPNARKLEMFARPPVPDGWDVWGNEIATSTGARALDNRG